jgi:hypothetical protein
MGAISALSQSLAQTQASFNAAAAQIAKEGLPSGTPSAIVPNPADPSAPGSPTAHFGVDPAEQLTTMMIAADSHHVTATAMKVALSTYQDSVDMLNDTGNS